MRIRRTMHGRMTFRVFVLMLCLGATSPTVVRAQAEKKSEFLDQVRLNFARWDADKDGVLVTHEIERAVADPQVKGLPAAAVAALRRAIRASRSVESLSVAQIEENVLRRATATPKLLNLEDLYRANLERIQTARRELFVSEKPVVECVSQGRLGDCFLLATLGTVAARDPDRLKRMFRLLEDGKVEVTLGTGRKLVLDMPTDAEMCIGARNRNDGMWALLFEKAIGTIYLERQKTPRHVTPLSIIGVGGTPNVPLELLTGHAVKRTGCEDFQRGQLDAEARERKLAEVRARLAEAFREGRLIVGGTAPLGGKQTIVPGLYYNHSYGVIDFNEKTDEVTFWNPFGNRYTPKGPPSLKTGFLTEHGRFTMPLADAVMWFGSFSIETGEKSTRFDP